MTCGNTSEQSVPLENAIMGVHDIREFYVSEKKDLRKSLRDLPRYRNRFGYMCLDGYPDTPVGYPPGPWVLYDDVENLLVEGLRKDP